MRYTLLLLCGSLLCGSARLRAQLASPSPGLNTSVAPAPFHHSGVRNLPYSLTETNTRVQTLADGTHITSTTQQRIMRDAEGRTRMESMPVAQDGAIGLEHVQIFDPVAQVMIHLTSSTKTAYVSHFGAPMPLEPEQQAAMAEARAKARAARANQPQPARPQGQRQVEKLGSQTIAGVYAEGVRYTRIIPAGAQGNDREMRSTDEVWTSPDLHIELERISDDPRLGKSTLLVTAIERITPDPGLFQIPADYTVVDRSANLAR